VTEKIARQTIFTDLDSLLDTRAGCISTFGKDSLETNITPSYFDRLSDKFQIEGYGDRYKARDKSVLSNSSLTPIITLIMEFVASTLQNNLNSPHVFKPTVIINTYPYVLNDEESNLVIRIIVNKTKEHADVQLVFMDYDELTPAYVRNNVSLMVMYDGVNWLDTQADAGRFNKKACPEVGLIVPAIGTGPDPKMDKNPFEIMETITAPIIGLKFLPVESFSLLLNPFK